MNYMMILSSKVLFSRPSPFQKKSSLEVFCLDPLMGGAMGRLQIEMSEPGKKYFYFMHNWQRKFENFKMAND